MIHALRLQQKPSVAFARGRARTRPVVCSAAGAAQPKCRIVFLGTPDVAAGVLKELLAESQKPGALFEVSMVVSQPGKPRGRGNRSQAPPSPVEALARESGLVDPGNILCPAKASEASFLERLQQARPDLAVTAAYGNMLPQRFLDLPPLGTLNIHPSLLPRFRGAAPVQRAVEAGVPTTGVSVAYTVLACDAGPVLAQKEVALDPDVTAPELLESLFAAGTRLLVEQLPHVVAGRGPGMARPQDESQVVHAPKLTREESILDFAATPGSLLHNRVRAFAGWPGTSGRFVLEDTDTGAKEAVEVKIVRTRSQGTGPAPAGGMPGAPGEVAFTGDSMLVPCAGGTVLEVLQVQPPTKKAMGARDFKNGLRKKRLLVEGRV